MTHLELIYIIYDSYSLFTLADATVPDVDRLSSTIIRMGILQRIGRFLFGGTYLAATRRHGCDRLNSMVDERKFLCAMFVSSSVVYEKTSLDFGLPRKVLGMLRCPKKTERIGKLILFNWT
jgi:hypothetical protein